MTWKDVDAEEFPRGDYWAQWSDGVVEEMRGAPGVYEWARSIKPPTDRTGPWIIRVWAIPKPPAPPPVPESVVALAAQLEVE